MIYSLPTTLISKPLPVVRALIFDVGPDVSEHVYPVLKVIRYGLEGNKMAGLVFFLMPHKERVNLGFNHGTSLPDPKGLLEGTGKNIRHVRLGDKEAVALHKYSRKVG